MRPSKTFRGGHHQPTDGGIRPSPARDKVRMVLSRMIADGVCAFTPESLASTADVSEKVAKSFIAAAVDAKMAESLLGVLNLGGNAVCLTSSYPGTPAEETIAMTSMLLLAKGFKGSPMTKVAFGYGTALRLHGLTEVAIPGFHLVKAMPSTAAPTDLDQNQPYQHKERPAKVWTHYRDAVPIYITMRPWAHLPTQDLVQVLREGVPVRVTSPLRTLVDAWMHPEWCGGDDRVLDSWKMFWSKRGGMEQPVRDLAVLLAETTWPGLWRELTRWAAGNIQGLQRLPEVTQRMQGIVME